MSRQKMQKELFEAEREQRYLEATAKAKHSGLSKPGRGLLPFLMLAEQEETSVTGRAGLPLVVATFRGHRGDDLVRELIKVKKRQRGFSEVEMIEAFLLLLASGGEHADDFEVLGQDDGLWLLPDREPPSPDAALTFLKRFHDELKIGLGANAAWYRLNVLTYNVLAALKKRLLPPAAQDIKARRLRYIAFDLAA